MEQETFRFLSREEVRLSLDMREAIELMRDAFIQLSHKEALVPLRVNMAIPDAQGNTLFMPVYLPKCKQVGLKVVSVFSENPSKGLPLIYGMVSVFDATTGRPQALMDGEYLTALRTGAGSGLATAELARKDARVAALFGCGVQAGPQLEAVCAVRDIERAYVFGRKAEKVAAFCGKMKDILEIEIIPATDPTLLKEADVICTATTALEPLFKDGNVKKGAHINAIGSYRPFMCEVPGETVKRARLVVDQREACLSEAGDLIQPMRKGMIARGHIWAELGEIAAGDKPGRQSDEEITMFKSVGNAVQDLAAASRILSNAIERGLGTALQF